MICLNCQKENNDKAKFCSGCGKGLSCDSAKQTATVDQNQAKVKGINKFVLISVVVVVVGVVGMLFISKGSSLVGTYNFTNYSELNSYGLNKNSEVHTLTIKEGRNFTVYDNYGGGNGTFKDVVNEGVGTYEIKGKQIIFQWTDSMRSSLRKECMLVDGGFDCRDVLSNIERYRKQK